MEEIQEIIDIVLETIRTNSQLIENLPAATNLDDSDSFEISGGRRVTFATLRKAIELRIGNLTDEYYDKIKQFVENFDKLILQEVDSSTDKVPSSNAVRMAIQNAHPIVDSSQFRQYVQTNFNTLKGFLTPALLRIFKSGNNVGNAIVSGDASTNRVNIVLFTAHQVEPKTTDISTTLQNTDGTTNIYMCALTDGIWSDWTEFRAGIKGAENILADLTVQMAAGGNLIYSRKFLNPKTGQTYTSTSGLVDLASETKSGLMSAEQVKALKYLNSRLFVNVNDLIKLYYPDSQYDIFTLSTALQRLAELTDESAINKLGLVITFQKSAGEWETWQRVKEGGFTQTSCWERFGNSSSSSEVETLFSNFINVNQLLKNNSTFTLQGALNSINTREGTDALKNVYGLVITFKTSDGWQIWQRVSEGGFTQASSWKQIGEGATKPSIETWTWEQIGQYFGDYNLNPQEMVYVSYQGIKMGTIVFNPADDEGNITALLITPYDLDDRENNRFEHFDVSGTVRFYSTIFNINEHSPKYEWKLLLDGETDELVKMLVKFTGMPKDPGQLPQDSVAKRLVKGVDLKQYSGNIALTLLTDSGDPSLSKSIPAATNELAGVMSAGQVQTLLRLDKVVRGLQTWLDKEEDEPDLWSQKSLQDMIASYSDNGLFNTLWDKACETRGSNASSAEPTCGKYDPDTKKYELNGITDLTFDEAVEIYQYRMLTQEDFYRKNEGYSKIRTNLNRFAIAQNHEVDMSFCCMNATQLEVFCASMHPTQAFKPTDLSYAFSGCRKLRKIIGIMDISAVGSKTTVAFSQCAALEDFKIKGLNGNLNLYYSPKVSFESMSFLVENAVNTSAVTISVHTDVYAKLTGTASGDDSEDWTALNQTARSKNISFANMIV